jgi:hypothetical protein
MGLPLAKSFSTFAMEDLPDRVIAGTYRHWASSPTLVIGNSGYPNITCDEEVFRCTTHHSSLCFFLFFFFNIGSVMRSCFACDPHADGQHQQWQDAAI